MPNFDERLAEHVKLATALRFVLAARKAQDLPASLSWVGEQVGIRSKGYLAEQWD